MKSVAFHIQKGGVGKTSLSCSIAVQCAKKFKTIIIDVDPQGNSTAWMLGGKTPVEYELADVLYGNETPSNAILSTQVPNLDILPTNSLKDLLKTYGENQLANEPFVFVDLLDSLEDLGYDFAFFDLSPGMGRLERSAIIAADEVITPITPEAFSLEGLKIFSYALDKTSKAMRRKPTYNKIIVNGVNYSIEQHTTIVSSAKKIKGFQLFILGVDPAFRKSQALSIPVQYLTGKESAKGETIYMLKKIGESICQ